jgi:hypothetical protein
MLSGNDNAYVIRKYSSSSRQVEMKFSAQRVFWISDALGTGLSSAELYGVIKYEERVDRRLSLLVTVAGRVGLLRPSRKGMVETSPK